MRIRNILATCQTLSGFGSGTIFIPSRAPALPLAVKSPYMNTWLEVGSGGNGELAGTWPRFWAAPQPGDVTGNTGSVTAWAGLIKVDGTTYTWMGAPQINGYFPPSVAQSSVEYTSQKTEFISTVAGKVSLTVKFTSPVTPKDLRRQSIIGTYLEVTVASIDENAHSVQLYADTSAEWVSIHSSDIAQWSFTNQNGVASHRSWRQNQNEFNADYPDDAPHWGYWYWSTTSAPSMTYQSGSDALVRQNFLSNSGLPNTEDSNYRAINNGWPVFGFANDLGNVRGAPVTTLYTVVHAQQNSVLSNGADGNQAVPSLWTSFFSSDLALVEFFYTDHPSLTSQIDIQISTDSHVAGGPDYSIITSLSTRQSLAAVQLTGTPSKPYLFLKEISSNGNTQTVDVIYPSIPIFLYLNPILVKYLLDPLYENQESGHWPHAYAIHDLGTNYPRAIGHEDGNAEEMPVEECGNMIVATLAYTQASGDVGYLRSHYEILRKWTGYLVEDSLVPRHQLSTDDFQGPLENQTNLAVKGIIAIGAMSKISSLAGESADAAMYEGIAKDYIAQWETYAVVNGRHTNLAYQDGNSHGLLYNIYADRLLSLNLIPQRIYDMQSAFYPTIAQTYGVPLDTRNFYTKTDWQIWAAAVSSPSTRSLFISKLATWIRETSTNRALTDLYHTQTGEYVFPSFLSFCLYRFYFAFNLPATCGLSSAPLRGICTSGTKAMLTRKQFRHLEIHR
ncbi:hypothetical protein BJ875DRAFT_540678 [Amylocarpus encephaloides]|uniref:Glutaminase A n=1 Tax=Amylocarpus encephaloides TaxID=45428 RepID=A0A9P8C9K8_9HELO|nr:hypothetical protein BJ875DRAFT_540678 [Amylocarpus encephaloides]